jgi:hypothetical protein
MPVMRSTSRTRSAGTLPLAFHSEMEGALMQSCRANSAALPTARHAISTGLS